jgi:hypothetical protein
MPIKDCAKETWCADGYRFLVADTPGRFSDLAPAGGPK